MCEACCAAGAFKEHRYSTDCSLAAALTGCGAGSTEPAPSAVPTPPAAQTARVVVVPSTFTPTLLSVATPSGEWVTYSGTKDGQGFPTLVYGITLDVANRDPAKRIDLELDANRSLRSARLASGGSVEFERTSSTTLRVVITDDHGNRGTLVLDAAARTIVPSSLRATGKGPLATASASQDAKARIASAASATSTGTIRLTCLDGNPDTQTHVVQNFFPDNLDSALPPNFSIPVWPTFVSPGAYYTYSASIENLPRDASIWKQFAGVIPDLVGDVCKTKDLFERFQRVDLQAAISSNWNGLYFGAMAPGILVGAVEALAVVCGVHSVLELAAKSDDLIAILGLDRSGTFTVDAWRDRAPNLSARRSARWDGPLSALPNFDFRLPCLRLSIAPPTAVELGGTQQLSVQVTGSNGAPSSSGGIYWDTADRSIAGAASATGLVAGYKVGATTVSVVDPYSGAYAEADLVVGPSLTGTWILVSYRGVAFGEICLSLDVCPGSIGVYRQEGGSLRFVDGAGVYAVGGGTWGPVKYRLDGDTTTTSTNYPVDPQCAGAGHGVPNRFYCVQFPPGLRYSMRNETEWYPLILSGGLLYDANGYVWALGS